LYTHEALLLRYDRTSVNRFVRRRVITYVPGRDRERTREILQEKQVDKRLFPNWRIVNR